VITLADELNKGTGNEYNAVIGGSGDKYGPPPGGYRGAIPGSGDLSLQPGEQLPRKFNPMQEFGLTGLPRFGGFVYEEWLQDLVGIRGRNIYREMRDNDPIIGAILFTIEMLCRQVSWSVKAGGDSPADQEAADFLNSCMHDMSTSWHDFITEALSMFVFGWSWHEICYKKRLGGADYADPLTRSKYDDGRIGWRKLPIRAQETLWRWTFDNEGGIKIMNQLPPPDFIPRRLPIEKALLFRTKSYKNNPEGRPIRVDTPVLTPHGWTTMGEIKVGDRVYDEQGHIRNVVGKSEVFTDRPVYEVVFSTDHVIYADVCHEWSVTTRNDRFNKKKPRKLTTEQMYKLLAEGKPRHFSCGQAPILEAERVDLPIDPYIMGYWLGNGITSKGAFSVSKEDCAFICSQFEAAGYRCNYDGNTTVSTTGLLTDLKDLGVLGNKYVPDEYMRAHPEQRLALLQGLMDSDGHSPGDKKDKASEFANTNMLLIRSVSELVRSLGGQPRFRVMEEAGSLGGTIKGRRIMSKNDVYEITFMLDIPVHRLPRKLKAQTLSRSSRTSGHFIRAIRRVDNADTVCIEVDSPNHLFLAGEGMVPTHNSCLRTAYRAWYFKKHIEEIEAIGVERDLAGLPVALVPPEILDVNASDAEKAVLTYVKNLVMSLRRDELEGVVFPAELTSAGTPSGYKLSLLSAGGSGRRQFDTNAIIMRYNQQIACTVMADFILLGQGKVGSFALHSDKTELFAQALAAWLDAVSEVINRHGVPRLFALNTFPGITKLPEVEHGQVKEYDLVDLAAYITALSGAGMMLFPDDELENQLRRAANLVEKQKDSDETAAQNLQEDQGRGGQGPAKQPGDGTTPEDQDESATPPVQKRVIPVTQDVAVELMGLMKEFQDLVKRMRVA
jgi:hypothetical protein